jgi:hypothetical protein
MPFPRVVIPAKAGNQGGWATKLDPGFRRCDGVLEVGTSWQHRVGAALVAARSAWRCRCEPDRHGRLRRSRDDSESERRPRRCEVELDRLGRCTASE